MRHVTCAVSGLLALLLAGCATIPRNGQQRPPDWQVVPPPSTPPSHSHQRPGFGRETGSSPVRPRAPHPFVETWLPLDAWGKQHGAACRRTGWRPSLSPTYSLSTTSNGVLVVQIGNRAAFWDGVEIFLAFPPELAGVPTVYLHRLDLAKTIGPLTTPFASSRTAPTG